jgi:hypothetical protein
MRRLMVAYVGLLLLVRADDALCIATDDPRLK